jgi:hypothetical protein
MKPTHVSQPQSKMNLNATKQITESVSVVAILNQIQVRIGERVEYVWFCNNLNEARYRWSCAIEAARRVSSLTAA